MNSLVCKERKSVKPHFVRCLNENNQVIENKWYAIVSPCYLVERVQDPISGVVSYRISTDSDKISWRDLTEEEMNEYELSDGLMDIVKNSLLD